MNIADLLTQLLREWDPTLNLDDPRFTRTVLAPLERVFSSNLPVSDPVALVRSTLSDRFPDIEGSALADVVGLVAALMMAPIANEIEASISRRRLDDDAVLSPGDLAESRDVFLVESTVGGYAEGSFRVYYTSPRSVSFDDLTVFRVPQTSGDDLIFRPTTLTSMTAAQMRAQTEGSLFFIDVPVRASGPGPQYNLEPLGVSGVSGPAGAYRISNPRRFRGGVAADNAASYLERIRSSLTTRTTATAAGLNHYLQNQGIPGWYLARTGDPLLLRDRLYGPTYIGGIPGGFQRATELESAPISGRVSLGLASDVWIPVDTTRELDVLRVLNLYDEGLLLVEGDFGSFGTTDPLELGNTGAFFRCRRRSFGPLVVDPEVYIPPFVPYTQSIFPLQADDVAQVAGIVTGVSGIRYAFRLLSTGYGPLTSGRDAYLEVPAGAGSSEVITGQTLARWEGLRVNGDPTDSTRARDLCSVLPHTRLPAFALPLRRRRALDQQGNPVKTPGPLYPLLEPGSDVPESDALGYIFSTVNVIDADSPPPITWAMRAELLDAVTSQPRAAGSRSFLYPASPLHVEFREPTETDASVSGSRAVRTRWHLYGPQGICFPAHLSVGVSGVTYAETGSGDPYEIPLPGALEIGRDAELPAGPYRPLSWDSTTYTATPSDGVSPETERLVLGTAGYLSEPLRDGADEIVYDVYGPRKIRPGDWVLMIPSTAVNVADFEDPAEWPDPYFSVPAGAQRRAVRAFPILSIESSTVVLVSAPDIPIGETGTLWVVQGASRLQLLSQDPWDLGLGVSEDARMVGGRGTEGTYSVDVFVGLQTPTDNPLLDQAPPMFTAASYDPHGLVIQGFHLYSAAPGVFYSPEEVVSAVFPTSYVNDGEELSGRAIQLYTAPAGPLESLNAALQSDALRPHATKTLVRLMPPARIVLAVFYDAADLATVDAETVLIDNLAEMASRRVLEPSDLVAALTQAGADYVVLGRMFLGIENHLRGFSSAVTRGTITLDPTSTLVIDTLIVRRLDRAARLAPGTGGVRFQETNPENWLEERVYRWGFNED